MEQHTHVFVLTMFPYSQAWVQQRLAILGKLSQIEADPEEHAEL